jgi:hypothetical protein
MNGSVVPLVELGIAEWRLAPQSGDTYATQTFPGGVLVAVIDGVGHGADAATAAKIAESVLTSHPDEELSHLASLCHEALKGTRGAVASLASVRAGQIMAWLGVGNVDGALVARRASRPTRLLATRGGVLGHNLPPLRADALRIVPGDTLVFATDGVDSSKLAALDPVASPQANAERIMAMGRKGNDDALVLVARYGGDPP